MRTLESGASRCNCLVLCSLKKPKQKVLGCNGSTSSASVAIRLFHNLDNRSDLGEMKKSSKTDLGQDILGDSPRVCC
jgi:hypothetical protein